MADAPPRGDVDERPVQRDSLGVRRVHRDHEDAIAGLERRWPAHPDRRTPRRRPRRPEGSARAPDPSTTIRNGRPRAARLSRDRTSDDAGRAGDHDHGVLLPAKSRGTDVSTGLSSRPPRVFAAASARCAIANAPFAAGNAAVDGALQQHLADLVRRETVSQRRTHVHLELVLAAGRDERRQRDAAARAPVEPRPRPDLAPGIPRDQVLEVLGERRRALDCPVDVRVAENSPPSSPSRGRGSRPASRRSCVLQVPAQVTQERRRERRPVARRWPGALLRRSHDARRPDRRGKRRRRRRRDDRVVGAGDDERGSHDLGEPGC